MRLRILSIGTRLPAWAEAGVADFLKRFPRSFPVDIDSVSAAARRGGMTPPQCREADSARLLQRVQTGERIVLLDERGRALDSRGLADRITDWQHDGRDVALLIGGPDGHSEALRARADETLSLSPMTLPHALARLLLVEQLYRAHSLLAGHPYHRD